MSIHIKFELDSVTRFSDNGQRPPFWPTLYAIFWPLEGQNWAIKPKLGQRWPKANQFWTLTQQIHTPNLKWIKWSLFQIMVENHGRTDRRMHRLSTFLCPLPTLLARTIKKHWTCLRYDKATHSPVFSCPPSAFRLGGRHLGKFARGSNLA